MLLKIIREELTLKPNGDLDLAEGSYNVPVSLQSDDSYPDYTITMYVGYKVKGIQKNTSCEKDQQGNYLIPAVALAQDGPLFISFLLEKPDKSEGFMCEGLTYIVGSAPYPKLDIDYDPSMEELVKEWVKEVIGDIDIEVNLSDYYTKTESDEKFATKEELKNVDVDLTEYSTTAQNDAKYQPKGTYLTSIPSEYVTDSELTAKGYLTQHQSLSAYSTTAQNDAKYQPKGSYASATHTHTEYATTTQFSQLTEEIVDQQNQLNNKQPKGNYALKEEIPSVDGLASETYVNNKIVDLKAQTVQNTPLFANSIDECTDTSKLYVLTDGYIYANGSTTTEVEKETVVSEAKASIVKNKRYSHSGQAYKDASGYSCIIVPIESTGTSQVHTISGVVKTSYWNGIYYGTTNTVFSSDATQSVNETDPFSFNSIPQGKYYVLFHAQVTSLTTITVNGKQMQVVESTNGSSTSFEVIEKTTETVTTQGFFKTGVKYGASVSVDSVLSNESVNPVQNKIVDAKFKEVENNISKIKRQSTDISSYIATVKAPPQLPANGTELADVDLTTCTSNDIHALLNGVVTRYPNYITRELMGKDESGQYDIYRYTLGKGTYKAWQKENYPRMYAWKNGNTIIYSLSVSPRIGDVMYSTKYVGTAYSTVTSVNATNRSRTVNGIEFVRSESNDIEPTLKYVRDTVRGNTMVTDGITYYRYPFGDTDANNKKRIPMTIIANEHGGHEVRDCSLIVTRLIKDLCEYNYQDNPVLNYIRENVSLTVIPCVNPYGWNKYMDTSGYYNYNGVNINRNYDTVGWDYCYQNQDIDGNNKLGSYAGSENETQYVMNTMSDSKSKIAMSVHGLSTDANNILTYYQGQNPNGSYSTEKTLQIREDLMSRYGLGFSPYNPLECPPTTTSKSPSYITQIGAYGGLIEFNCNDAQISEGEENRRYTSWTMEQQYTLLLKFLAMWISDYEESL